MKKTSKNASQQHKSASHSRKNMDSAMHESEMMNKKKSSGSHKMK